MVHCTFAGHRLLMHAEMEKAVRDVLSDMLKRDDSFCFYSGGMGEFDRLCGKLVREYKAMHPEKKIELLLVIPYMTQSINEDREMLTELYDGVILPDELTGIHYKAAIDARNRWMVDRCNCVIAYLVRSSGGAWKTVRYAQSRGITVLHTVWA